MIHLGVPEAAVEEGIPQADVVVVGEAHVPTLVEETALEEPVESVPAPPDHSVTNPTVSPPHALFVVEEGIAQPEAAVEHLNTSAVPPAAEEIIIEKGVPQASFVAEASPVPPPAEETAVGVAAPRLVVPEGIPQTEVDSEEPAAETISPPAAPDASVIEEGASHSDDIVEESTEPLATPAHEFVTSLPVETEHRKTAADVPAVSNLPVVEDIVSVGVEAADAPVVGEPSIVVQGNLEEEKVEAEVIEAYSTSPPAPTDETVVPSLSTDAPIIEAGIQQGVFTAEVRVTLAEETDLEGPEHLAPLQVPTETIVAPDAEPDTPIVGEGITQPDIAIEEPPLEIAAEESAAVVPTPVEEAETVPAVLEAPIEEGIFQAEVIAEGSKISLSLPVEEIVPPFAPAPVEERIPQAEIVEDSVTRLPAPAEEIVVPPSPPIESDHAEAIAVPAAVSEASNEASAPPAIKEAAGVFAVEGPDHPIDEPLALVEEAQSAPAEVEGAKVDPPALLEPVANEETVTIASVPTVESALAVPEASKETSVPAVTIEDLPEAEAPPVEAAANSEEEVIGSLVEPAIAVAPEVPQAAEEPAIIEEQHSQDDDSSPPALEGETIPSSLLTPLKLTPPLI